MGTDDPGTEQPRPRAPDERSEPRLAGAGRVVAPVRRAARRLRARTGTVLAAVVHAVRAAVRYYLEGGRRDASAQPLATRPGAFGRSIATREHSDGQAGQSSPQLAETGGRSRPRQLPGPAGQRRRLPAGDGRLQVERTPERLTLSDPDDEEAYLSSTLWVDVEE